MHSMCVLDWRPYLFLETFWPANSSTLHVAGPQVERRQGLGADFNLTGVNSMTTLRPIQELGRTGGRMVIHPPSSAHVRCACGESLVFGAERRSFQGLLNLRTEGSLKVGECPACGCTHCVDFSYSYCR